MESIKCSVSEWKLRVPVFCRRIEWSGACWFCPVRLFVCVSVCLSVVNFNIRDNVWIFRDIHFIFGTHTQRMITFPMTPMSMDLCHWLTFMLIIVSWFLMVWFVYQFTLLRVQQLKRAYEPCHLVYQFAKWYCTSCIIWLPLWSQHKHLQTSLNCKCYIW